MHHGWSRRPYDDYGSGEGGGGGRRGPRKDNRRSPRRSRSGQDSGYFRDDAYGGRPRHSPGRRYDHADPRQDDYSYGRPAQRGAERRDTTPRRSYFDDDITNVHLTPADFTDLPEFRRFFYEIHPDVAARSAQEVDHIRCQMGITVHPSDACPPVLSFEEAFSQGYILETIHKQSFSHPTPIQCQSWPIVLSGHNMIGIAETGSGKTLAYLLPALIHMLFQDELGPGEGPMALILAPTRELSIQIFEECEKFGEPCGVKSACIYGGAKKAPQIRELKQGVHLLVATPGRLIDMLESRVTNLRRVTYLVLDEADRMLDMGFEPQIRKIVDQVRPDRQTVLWSATWPRGVEDIASEFLTSPYKVTIGSEDLKANHNITQRFERVGYRERKIDKLVEFLKVEENRGRILIFCATKTTVDEVTLELRKLGFGALGIHGDKEQAEREWVLEEFKTGSSPIMVATDVAQRGLDIKNVYCVVNYDLPSTGEDYVHRIGRTGRAGLRGVSVSFFTERDSRIAKSVVRVLEEAGQEIPPDLRRFAENVVREPSFRGGGRGGGGVTCTGANAFPLHKGWR